jgi:hypothetical protein
MFHPSDVCLPEVCIRRQYFLNGPVEAQSKATERYLRPRGHYFNKTLRGSKSVLLFWYILSCFLYESAVRGPQSIGFSPLVFSYLVCICQLCVRRSFSQKVSIVGLPCYPLPGIKDLVDSERLRLVCVLLFNGGANNLDRCW